MLNDDYLFHTSVPSEPPEWRVHPGLIAYPEAIAFMEQHIAQIDEGKARELIWLVEHPPLYTAGTGAKEQDLLDTLGLPVYRTGRGGQFTYHGPGQRVVYVMLDLRRRKQDIRAFVNALEEWVIQALDRFNIDGERRDGRIGVWVKRPDKAIDAEDKIAAIGVRLRRWISFHGISLNVEPDLSHYRGIIPCGIREHGVTSLIDLGRPVTMDDADAALKAAFSGIFGPIQS
jgi:lipoyl(octanoyl) transferase